MTLRPLQNEITEQVRELVQGVVMPVGIDALYLFGSQAKGNPTPLSDIDLAVLPGVAEVPHDSTWRDELAEYIRSQLTGNKVDIVFLDEAPLALQFSVVNQGRLLYQRKPEVRVAYEVAVRQRYFDFQPILAEHRRALLARWKGGRIHG